MTVEQGAPEESLIAFDPNKPHGTVISAVDLVKERMNKVRNINKIYILTAFILGSGVTAGLIGLARLYLH